MVSNQLQKRLDLLKDIKQKNHFVELLVIGILVMRFFKIYIVRL